MATGLHKMNLQSTHDQKWVGLNPNITRPKPALDGFMTMFQKMVVRYFSNCVETEVTKHRSNHNRNTRLHKPMVHGGLLDSAHHHVN